MNELSAIIIYIALCLSIGRVIGETMVFALSIFEGDSFAAKNDIAKLCIDFAILIGMWLAIKELLYLV